MSEYKPIEVLIYFRFEGDIIVYSRSDLFLCGILNLSQQDGEKGPSDD